VDRLVIIGGQLLIARAGRGVRQRVWHLRPQRGFGHPGGQQPRIYVGQVLDEQLTAPGHDNMRLDDLRRRGAERRRGGGFHVRGRLKAVPLEDQDLVPGPGQQQPGEQARGTASGNDDIQCVPLSASTAPPHGAEYQGKTTAALPVKENPRPARDASQTRALGSIT
jgi:hypothetical protein